MIGDENLCYGCFLRRYGYGCRESKGIEVWCGVDDVCECCGEYGPIITGVVSEDDGLLY